MDRSVSGTDTKQLIRDCFGCPKILLNSRQSYLTAFFRISFSGKFDIRFQFKLYSIPNEFNGTKFPKVIDQQGFPFGPD